MFLSSKKLLDTQEKEPLFIYADILFFIADKIKR